MSFQVPGGMAITGAMLQFYKTVPQVIFWQWFNQSFNALVNFTNRNAQSSSVSIPHLAFAYVSATVSAVGTALGLKKLLESRMPPFVQRFVPMIAVAAANCVNLPLMRQTELLDGVELTDENGSIICSSKYAAGKGIGQVVLSRNIIMAPGMVFLPFIMNAMEKKTWFARRPLLHAPFQVLGVGCFLIIMVPFGCAVFPQSCSISLETLKKYDYVAHEQAEKWAEKTGENIPSRLYFNKGL